MLQVATGKFPEVDGLVHLESETDRRKHHIKQLEKNNPFHPFILQCLCESKGRPCAFELCKSLKGFIGTKKTTIDFINESFVAQKEKDDLSLELKQKNSDLQKVQVMQENLLKELEVLQTKYTEEKDF